MAKITKIEITNDKISGRGGITLFLRYIFQTKSFRLIENVLSLNLIKGSGKGLSLKQFLIQILACFIDGTDMSMSGFDRKKEDAGYTAVLENTREDMASSHQMKRFFAKLGILGNGIYRKILHHLFIWRLRIEKPKIIFLDIDTWYWITMIPSIKRDVSQHTRKRRVFNHCMLVGVYI